ncbi:MAG: tRNA (guanosine(37)-N1)-methyltransferase TrmD [Chloroflexi bacterium]|nr:tRNA (guanosine(37)-N1)-methyltransferase TrmD [Chloroflexota bacterium]
MRIDVLTLFPHMFEAPFSAGIFRRAIDQGRLAVNVVNFRDFAHDRHHTVDDYPYGGGPGMVLKPEPIFEAVESLGPEKGAPVILLTPQGRLFSQDIARELSSCARLVLICGHYEGVDERVRCLATDEISIGDYVLTGGELPALVVMDAVIRLVPGVLGSEFSPVEESHTRGLLEYPQYTRPPVYREWPVPEVLLSGDHARIARWRREDVIRRTLERRPDLLERAVLDEQDTKIIRRLLAAEPVINRQE